LLAPPETAVTDEDETEDEESATEATDSAAIVADGSAAATTTFLTTLQRGSAAVAFPSAQALIEEGAVPGGERTLSGGVADLTEVFAAGDTAAPTNATVGNGVDGNASLGSASSTVVVETDNGDTIEFFSHDPAPIAWIDPLATLGHDFITHSDSPESVAVVDSGRSLVDPFYAPMLIADGAAGAGYGVGSTQGAPPTGDGLQVDAMLDSDDPLAFVTGVTSARAALDSPIPSPVTIAAVPEPAAVLLLAMGIGLRSLISARRRSGRASDR
jgi:hypothetical protein